MRTQWTHITKLVMRLFTIIFHTYLQEWPILWSYSIAFWLASYYHAHSIALYNGIVRISLFEIHQSSHWNRKWTIKQCKSKLKYKWWAGVMIISLAHVFKPFSDFSKNQFNQMVGRIDPIGILNWRIQKFKWKKKTVNGNRKSINKTPTVLTHFRLWQILWLEINFVDFFPFQWKLNKNTIQNDFWIFLNKQHLRRPLFNRLVTAIDQFTKWKAFTQ